MIGVVLFAIRARQPVAGGVSCMFAMIAGVIKFCVAGNARRVINNTQKANELFQFSPR